ncbi:hypothetical protein KSS87_017843 [Heliosperma pusillum]|nr:hypothetical protein KSS87_017843 [Heliosperma pusillum]
MAAEKAAAVELLDIAVDNAVDNVVKERWKKYKEGRKKKKEEMMSKAETEKKMWRDGIRLESDEISGEQQELDYPGCPPPVLGEGFELGESSQSHDSDSSESDSYSPRSPATHQPSRNYSPPPSPPSSPSAAYQGRPYIMPIVFFVVFLVLIFSPPADGEVFQSTISEVDLDRILQSIPVYLQELGMDEIRRRAGADDKPLRMVKTVLHELVKLQGTAIKGHLSMVPIDMEPPSIILEYIDLNLQVYILPQLQNASEAFRTYIRDGLAQMEKNAAAGKTPSSVPFSTPLPAA